MPYLISFLSDGFLLLLTGPDSFLLGACDDRYSVIRILNSIRWEPHISRVAACGICYLVYKNEKADTTCRPSHLFLDEFHFLR